MSPSELQRATGRSLASSKGFFEQQMFEVSVEILKLPRGNVAANFNRVVSNERCFLLAVALLYLLQN